MTSKILARAILDCRLAETVLLAGTGFVLFSLAGNAQGAISASTYPLSSSSGVALEDMSSGTTQLLPPISDSDASLVIDIGFDFWFDGARFTRFSANSDGLARLGNSAVSINSSNNLDDTVDSPKIAPYWNDLEIGSNGKLHYKVVGSAPNRKLVVEWLNEQIPRLGSISPGAGTFQMWLFESSGVIEFVYGNGIAVDSVASGYSVGIQSGAATNFASVTTSGNTVSYLTANDTQTNAVAPGTAYAFTPNLPAAPTGLSLTNITAVSMTLNWTDNATNEVGYVIYQSTDNVNFSFVAQTAANATSQTVGGLSPNTTYFFKVFALTEGALSTALTGSQATTGTSNISSAAVTGNWSAPATWVGGVIPSASDNVIIVNGANVTIDTDAHAYSLIVGTGAAASLKFEPTTARTLTVETSVQIATNGTFQSAATGTVTTHVLSVGTSLTNNGVLDFSTNTNTAAADITFTGPNDAIFTGTGATTDIRTITIDKGNSTTPPVLELMPTNFSVRGVATNVAGFLTLTNGTFKISGNLIIANRIFTTASYSIPFTAGLWLNNPNFTVSGQNGSPTLRGLLRISNGTLNVGTSSGNAMVFAGGCTVIVEGGAINVSGRFGATSTYPFTYHQSGGTITVCTVGNVSSGIASFDLFDSPFSDISISGGTIVVQLAGTGSSGPHDYRNSAGNPANVTGGTLQLGNSSSGAAKTFLLTGAVPNLIITSTSAGHAGSFQVPFTFPNQSLNLTIPDTTGLSIGSSTFLFKGTTITNDGNIGDSGGNARFDFAGNAPMTYSGTGDMGFAVQPLTAISSASASLVTLQSPIVTNRVNLFQGGFVNSNQITLGNGGSSTTTVQVGSPGQITPGGNFDVSPIHQQGTGGQVLMYLQESTPRTAGVELNPTRVLNSLTIDNTNNVTFTGGNLTLSSTSSALSLTHGALVIGNNTVILSSASALVSHSSGYVDGNLQRTFAINESKMFDVGAGTGYSPVTVNMTSGIHPAVVTVRAQSGQQPNSASYPGILSALNRYWTVSGPGTALLADLTFQYQAGDVVGEETNYELARFNGSWVGFFPSLNTTTHTASFNNVSSLTGDWTLIAADADADGMPDSFEDRYSLNKNNPSDANLDADGDGQTNLAEYLAGTDPRNATSALRVTSVLRSGSTYTVHFDAIASKPYRLEFKNSITDPNWQTVSDLTPGVSGDAQITDMSASGGPRFYRVRLLLP